MKQLIEYALDDGDSILVEVNDDETHGGTLRGGAPKIALKALETLEASLDKVKPAAAAIISKLRDLKDSPEQVAVEFGIKLSAAAGVVLASSGAEANFKVTLSWKKEEKFKT